MSRFVAGALVLIVLMSFTVQAGQMAVHVEGIESEKGTVFIGIYKKGSFPETGGELRGAKIEADGSDLTHIFTELPPGNYAISLFHDENGNEELDTNFLGMPQEKYGFSNDVFNWYGGPPDFEKAMVTLEKNENLELSVRAKSWPPQV